MEEVMVEVARAMWGDMPMVCVLFLQSLPKDDRRGTMPLAK